MAGPSEDPTHTINIPLVDTAVNVVNVGVWKRRDETAGVKNRCGRDGVCLGRYIVLDSVCPSRQTLLDKLRVGCVGRGSAR